MAARVIRFITGSSLWALGVADILQFSFVPATTITIGFLYVVMYGHAYEWKQTIHFLARFQGFVTILLGFSHIYQMKNSHEPQTWSESQLIFVGYAIMVPLWDILAACHL